MRSYDIKINLKGLKPYEGSIYNSGFLTKALNFEITDQELRSIRLPSLMEALPESSFNFPLPIAFKGSKYNFFLGNDLYIVDNNWEVFTSLGTFNFSEVPDFIDFGLYYLFVSTSLIVIVDMQSDPPVITSSGTGTEQFPAMTSGCLFKGRLFGGGVLSSWYDCDYHSVIWSNFGELNCILNQSNESGYQHIKPGTAVKKLKVLGDRVIVYTDGGMTALTSQGGIVGHQDINFVGLYSKEAIAGDFTEHCFLGSDFNLYKHYANGTLTKLGYKDFMGSFDTSDRIVITHEYLKNRYYISNGSICYLLSPEGLTEVSAQVTTYVDDLIYYPYFYNNQGIIETEFFDLAIPELKTFIQAYFPGNFKEGRIQFLGYYDLKDSKASAKVLRLINPHGVAFPRVTCRKAKILVTFGDYKNLHLPYIVFTIQTSSRIYTRGTYVEKSTS